MPMSSSSGKDTDLYTCGFNEYTLDLYVKQRTHLAQKNLQPSARHTTWRGSLDLRGANPLTNDSSQVI